MQIIIPHPALALPEKQKQGVGIRRFCSGDTREALFRRQIAGFLDCRLFDIRL